MANSISWSGEALFNSLDDASKKALRFLSRKTEYYSLRSETYAKSKAPWKDRSTNARGGLTSTYQVEKAGDSTTFAIDVFHRVPYGIFLEIRWNGKWGIINKTVQKNGEDFFRSANNLLSEMFGG